MELEQPKSLAPAVVVGLYLARDLQAPVASRAVDSPSQPLQAYSLLSSLHQVSVVTPEVLAPPRPIITAITLKRHSAEGLLHVLAEPLPDDRHAIALEGHESLQLV